jgi:hypothetical protein
VSGDYKQPLAVTRRTRFYDGQYLVDQDFIDEQKYHVDRQRRHQHTLHVSGIASGLEVTPGQGARVVVGPGTAVDRDGRQIVLAEAWSSGDLSAAAYLYIVYNPVPVQVQQSDAGVQGETRLEEMALVFTNPERLGEDDSYDLSNTDAWKGATWADYEEGSLPPPVLLAHVQIDGGRPVIDTSARRYAGARLPHGASSEASVLRADDNGSVSVWTMVDGALAPRLTVTQDGNVGIGTPTPAAKLDVQGALSVGGATTIGGDLAVGTPNQQANLRVAGTLQVLAGPTINEFSTDPALADRSDSALPTERAVRSYVDGASDRLAVRIAIIEGANLPTRVGNLEGANLPTRVGNLEGANLPTRVGNLEGANLPARVGNLEGANLPARVGNLEGGKHPYGGTLNIPFTTNQLNVASGVNNFIIQSADASPNNGYIRFGDGSGWRLNFGRLRETSGQQSWNTSTTGVLMTLDDRGHLGIGTLVSHEMLTVDPGGPGGILIGNPETGAGSYTSLGITISQRQNGYANIQAISSAGTSYGNIFLNPLGGSVGIGSNSLDARYKLVINGAIQCSGLSSGQPKNFEIPHPLRSDRNLVHACIEGPEAAVYYRGTAQLRDGRAVIQLPDYFEALTRAEDRTVQLTPVGERPYLLSYTPVVDGAFTVYGDQSDGVVSWQVIAVRGDIAPLEVEVENA